MLIIEIIHQAKKKNLCVISLVLCDSLNLCNFIDDIYTYIYIYIYIFFFFFVEKLLMISLVVTFVCNN